MNAVGTLPDIPKVYTALAEYLSCGFYILLCNQKLFRKQHIPVLGISLISLILVQLMIGELPDLLWIPGMTLALSIMLLTIRKCCDFSTITAAYWMVRAFVLAELAASLEWQLYFFFAEKYSILETNWIQCIFLTVIFGCVFGLAYLIESRQSKKVLNINRSAITRNELWSAAIIGIAAFLMSNLSYVYAYTPFSSNIATEVFNIRTLIGLGGYGFLYAYHLQRSDYHIKAELDAIQSVLHKQYVQYRQSKESIEIINHKYHDLKHQIQILRRESNPDKREEYLDEIELEIRDYEARYKTGNAVLDTVLSGKGLLCAKQNIILTCVADGHLIDTIYVMDICTIFGNALDNAIEYVMTIQDMEKRLIHVSVSEVNNFVLIRIENYFEEEIVFKEGLPISTKADKNYHGFGLKSIKYSSEKYNGTITVKVEDDWFVLKILIPQPAKNC